MQDLFFLCLSIFLLCNLHSCSVEIGSERAKVLEQRIEKLERGGCEYNVNHDISFF